MAAPFNMPDEFVRGFFKSGQTLLQAYTGAAGKHRRSAVVPRQNCRRSRSRRRRRITGSSRWRFTWAWWRARRGKSPTPAVEPERGDRRFNADAWRDNPWYSLLKQTYLLNSRLLNDMVEAAGVGEKEKHKLRFYARQFIDSMSPANFRRDQPRGDEDAPSRRRARACARALRTCSKT